METASPDTPTLLSKNGVVVQHADGSLEGVATEIAEKHLGEMSPERRACYQKD